MNGEEGMSGVTFVLDVDGTICPIKSPTERYEDLVPYESVVGRMREAKADGARIVLFTSRNMRTYGGDLSLIREHTLPVLRAWLAKWGVPYDEIVIGKPWPGARGLYVDDRSVRPDEFASMGLAELEELCERGRRRLK